MSYARDRELLSKWLRRADLRMGALVLACSYLVMGVIAAFMSDWPWTVVLLGLCQIVIWIADKSRADDHTEMRANGYGHLFERRKPNAPRP